MWILFELRRLFVSGSRHFLIIRLSHPSFLPLSFQLVAHIMHSHIFISTINVFFCNGGTLKSANAQMNMMFCKTKYICDTLLLSDFSFYSKVHVTNYLPFLHFICTQTAHLQNRGMCDSHVLKSAYMHVYLFTYIHNYFLFTSILHLHFSVCPVLSCPSGQRWNAQNCQCEREYHFCKITHMKCHIKYTSM